MENIEDTKELRAIYKLGGLVLFIPKDLDTEDVESEAIQVDFYSKTYTIYNTQKLLKFNSFVPIKNDESTQEYFNGLIYQKLPSSVVMSMMRKYSYKPKNK